MSIRVRTNMESLIAQRTLGESNAKIKDSLVKLSSGQRINKAADDAAGLAVSETIRARLRGLDVSQRNASDGISLMQVAEGGLNEVTNNIVRMRELASQAASDTLGMRERSFLNKEFQQIRKEVNRIVESTEFNGSKVLKASENEKPLQIFVGASYRGDDAQGNTPDFDIENDADILTIDLSELKDFGDSIEIFKDDNYLSVVPNSSDGGAPDLGKNGTHDLFNKLDTALDSIASYRATLGSVQSRLDSTITNISVAKENLSAAQSRIRDVDFAAETARYAQNRILTQAGASVLAQANQTPEIALQLIR